MKQTMLIICAYPSDFVWEAGATIARYTKEGHAVHIVVLADGENESRAYVTAREEARRAASVLGVAPLIFCGYNDKPLVMEADRCEALACTIREIRPDLIVTHARERDITQPNYFYTSEAVRFAYTIASAAGASRNRQPVSPRQTPMFGFEPSSPEIAKWLPGFMIDATPFWEMKEQAMNELKSEQERIRIVTERALIRGVHCAGRGGKTGSKYAEAFSAYGPIYAHGYFVW